MKRKNQNNNNNEKEIFPPLYGNFKPIETEQNAVDKDDNKYINLLTKQNEDNNNINFRESLINSVGKQKIKENRIFIKILCIVGVFIVLIIQPLFKVYVASEYYVAWKYVPFLVVGYVFMTSATFISSSYNVHKDSKGFLYSGIVGAIINIILNIILIPSFKTYGAAFATMISYITVFIYRIIDTKKYLKIEVSKNQIIYLLLLIFSCCIIYIPKTHFIIALILILLLLLSFNDFILIFKTIINSVKTRKTK